MGNPLDSEFCMEYCRFEAVNRVHDAYGKVLPGKKTISCRLFSLKTHYLRYISAEIAVFTGIFRT